MSKRKAASALLAMMMVAGSTVPAYAASNYASWIPSFSGGIVSGSASTIPQNVKAVFKHKGIYSYMKDHLEVSFSKVSGAASYEVRMVKITSSSQSSGTAKSSALSKMYKTDTNFLIAYPDNLVSCDENIDINVRAVFSDGSYSDWSETVHMTCR